MINREKEMTSHPRKQTSSSQHTLNKKDILNVLADAGIQRLKNLTVLGVSMAPTIQPGDRVHIERGVYFPGDIILFVRDETLVLHRMVGWWKVNGQWCHVTKGDNLPNIDGFVPQNTIIGKATSWARNGRKKKVRKIQCCPGCYL